MQFMTLEDEGGFIDVTFFPGTFPAATYLGMGPYRGVGHGRRQSRCRHGHGDAVREAAPIVPWR